MAVNGAVLAVIRRNFGKPPAILAKLPQSFLIGFMRARARSVRCLLAIND